MAESIPRILFLTLTNDGGSDRIVSHMGRHGAVCAVLGRAGCFAARSRFAASRFTLPSFGGTWLAAWCVKSRLERIAARWVPDLVIPLDDMSAHLLRGLAVSRRSSAGLRKVLAASLGDASGYAAACSRDAIIEAAARLGIRTPAQRRASDLPSALEAGAALGYPVVLKREQTCGGDGVAVVTDAEGLKAAFGSAERRATLKHRAQQVLGIGSGAPASLTLQAFVPGTLAMRTVACADGRILEGASFEAERLHPAVVGASTILHPIENREMDEAARRLVAALGCSGIVSFDFMLDRDNDAHLIEMNARPIGSGHLGVRAGHDVYGALVSHLSGRTPARPRADGIGAAPGSIVLFPKEIDRDPASPCFGPGSTMFHDVPWDEPDVLAAHRERLLRKHPHHAATIHRLLDRTAAPTPAGSSGSTATATPNLNFC